jgi:phosphatidate phosphatase APP1
VKVRPVILPPGAPALVSDLDDTVVETGVTGRKAMLSSALPDNAAGPEPVSGVAALYREIRSSQSPPVPVFWLCGSPVHLHGRLRAFLEMHGSPPGPMRLKDPGRDGADPILEQEAY